MRSPVTGGACVVTVVCLLLLGAPDHAAGEGDRGEVAHSAMGGSTLIRTTASLNAWTHLIVEDDSFVELSVDDRFGGEDGIGHATLHWKYDDGNHLLFQVRPGDLGAQNINYLWGGTLESPLLSPASLVDAIDVSDYNAYRDGQMLNVAWARPLDAGGAFSAGLFVARRGEMYTLESSSAGGGSSAAEERESENRSTAFGTQATWGSGNGLDLSLSITRESSVDNALRSEWTNGELRRDIKNEESGTFFSLGLAARYEPDSNWIFQFGGLIARGSSEAEDYDYRRNRTPNEVILTSYPDVDYSLLGVVANAGRHLLESENAGVASEVFVSYLRGKHETQVIERHGTDEYVYDTSYQIADMVVPGMRVSCWARISNRFRVMAGANAVWTRMRDKEEAVLTSWPVGAGLLRAEGKETWSDYGMIYSYSGGLAYCPGDRFRLEGQFAMNQLHRILSLGNTTPLLVRVGGTYSF